MKVSHCQGTAVGDFLNTLPFLSYYTQLKNEKASISLLPCMQNFTGLKEFLEYQPFIDKVYFDGPTSDCVMDLQIYCTLANQFGITDFPRRSIGTARLAGFDQIDRNLTLRFPSVQTVEDVSQKIIVADRVRTQVMRKSGQFDNPNFFWLDYSKDMIYNLNLMSRSKLPVYATFTGVAILLNLCRIPVKLIYYEDLVNYYGRPVNHFHTDHHFLDRPIELVWYKDLFGNSDRINRF